MRLINRKRQKNRITEAVATPKNIDEPLPPVSIRILTRKDLDSAEFIDKSSSKTPLEGWKLRELQSARFCYGYVAEIKDTIIGFVLFDLGYSHIHVLRIAVLPCFQRMGVASLLMDRVKSRLTNRRKTLRLDCCETNLPCQLFLRSQEFLCDSIVPDVGGGYSTLEFLYVEGNR